MALYSRSSSCVQGSIYCPGLSGASLCAGGAQITEFLLAGPITSSVAASPRGALCSCPAGSSIHPWEAAWEDVNQIWALWLLYFYVQIKMLLELPLYPCCQLRPLPKCTVDERSCAWSGVAWSEFSVRLNNPMLLNCRKVKVWGGLFNGSGVCRIWSSEIPEQQGLETSSSWAFLWVCFLSPEVSIGVTVPGWQEHLL